MFVHCVSENVHNFTVENLSQKTVDFNFDTENPE